MNTEQRAEAAALLLSYLVKVMYDHISTDHIRRTIAASPFHTDEDAEEIAKLMRETKMFLTWTEGPMKPWAIRTVPSITNGVVGLEPVPFWTSLPEREANDG